MPPLSCMGRGNQQAKIMTFTNLAIKGIREIRRQVERIYYVIFSRSEITGYVDAYMNSIV